MYVLLIPAVCIVVVLSLSWKTKKDTKQYYENKNGAVDELSKELAQEVRNLVLQVQPELKNTIIVNGNYKTSKKIVIRSTTYYSYAILYNTVIKSLQLIGYNNNNKTAYDLGTYSVPDVRVHEMYDGMQTNYFFTSADGEEYIVHTKGHDMPVQDEYQTEYFQENEYNLLRKAFKLSPYIFEY